MALCSAKIYVAVVQETNSGPRVKMQIVNTFLTFRSLELSLNNTIQKNVMVLHKCVFVSLQDLQSRWKPFNP